MRADSKAQRHRLLRQIVADTEIHTQEDLVEALRQQGITVTQATVSRDIVELGLVRAAIGGRAVYTLPEIVAPSDAAAARRRLASLLGEVPLAFGEAAALLIVRTAPGMANMVAVTLDLCAYPEIVGTVAGDDTIFIAVRRAEDREQVQAYLSELPQDLAR